MQLFIDFENNRGNMQYQSARIEDVEEDEYFEEEVLSMYDTGLSTIVEGEYEDSSCSSRQGSPSQKVQQSPSSVPAQINLTPPGKPAGMHISSANIPLVSPLLFSPVAEARKLRIHSFKSPKGGGRSKAPVSPGGHGKKSPAIAKLPLVLTNLETGEELLVDGEDDDDYTFVSYYESESVLGLSSRSSEGDYGHEEKQEISADEENQGVSDELDDSSKYDICAHPPSQHLDDNPLDFESKRRALKNALERSVKKGALPAERFDYMRRKLKYELQRKMFKERLSHCLVPAQY